MQRNETEMITLAIQKSGRWSEKSTQLLKDCGIYFANGDSSKLKAKAQNFPLQILYLRDDDIPECIADGAADIGIIGENVYLESGKPLRLIKRLGFAGCRLSIAVPKQMEFESVSDLAGKSIATSYPRILQKYLDKKNVEANIHQITGSVEVAPGIGLADAVFDIVSSGSTLISNGLKEVEKVMDSEAVLIANSELDAEKRVVLEKLLFRIQAVKKAGNYKYILLNAPDEKIDEIVKIIPGMKSPTLIPLAEEGWHSLHSVIQEEDFWENIENLKKAGAQGILIIPIEKMVI